MARQQVAGAWGPLTELTNGNFAAQEALRRKRMNTTLAFYKKRTQSALSNARKLLEAKAGVAGHFLAATSLSMTAQTIVSPVITLILSMR